MIVPIIPRPFSWSRVFLVHLNRKRKNTMLRNLPCIRVMSFFARSCTYKSMLSDKSWPFELAFFAAKVLRKLTGILEVPGILIILRPWAIEAAAVVYEV